MGVARRPAIYYGWYVLGVAMLGAFLAAGFAQIFSAAMLKPISEDRGWSRTSMAGAITVSSIVGGLVAPFVGRLVDRYGPRALTSIGGLLTGSGYLAVAMLDELWQYYLAFLMARLASGGALSGVVPNAVAANWFRRRRGRAMGLAGMCLPLGGAVLGFAGQLLIEATGTWRTIFLALGVLTLGLLTPAAFLIMRRFPEDLGLLPDGAAAAVGTADPGLTTDERNWTLREALHTPSFWLLTAALSLAIVGVSSITFHQVAYYTDMGIAPTVAVAALSSYALSGALATGLGLLTERLPERALTVAALLFASGVTLCLIAVQSPIGAFLFAVMFGLTARGEGTLFNLLLVQYFGRRSFGAISGVTQPFFALGNGLGPLFSAPLFDWTHSYVVVFSFSALVTLSCALLVWLARKPVRRGARG